MAPRTDPITLSSYGTAWSPSAAAAVLAILSDQPLCRALCLAKGVTKDLHDPTRVACRVITRMYGYELVQWAESYDTNERDYARRLQ